MDLYFSKKQQLEQCVTPSSNVLQVETKQSLESKRSQSPMPQRSVVPDSKGKITYKADLDAVKDDLMKKINELLSQQLAHTNTLTDLSAKLENIVSQLSALQKLVDVSKVDVLRQNINDTVAKINASLTNVQDHITSHLDKINTIDSRLSTIESVM